MLQETTAHTENATEVMDTSHDDQIVQLVETVRSYQDKIATMEEKISAAKQQLSGLLQQRGAGWTDEEGYARLFAEGERVSYMTKALDELLIEDPLRYGWLKDYRKKTLVKGGVQVR